MNIIPVGMNNNYKCQTFKANASKVAKMSEILSDSQVSDKMADMIIAAVTTALATAGIKINSNEVDRKNGSCPNDISYYLRVRAKKRRIHLKELKTRLNSEK